MEILRGNSKKYLIFVLLGLVSAAGNLSIISMLNRIISNYVSDTPVKSQEDSGYFFLALVVFFTSRWVVSRSMIGFTQAQLRKSRLEVLRIILRSAYYPLLRNKDKIYNAMTRDTSNVVNASVNLVDILTNTIVAGICFIYMWVLSWKLMLCVLVLLIFTVCVYFFFERKARRLYDQALSWDDKFIKYLNEILDGFKEVVIEKKKGTDIINTHISKAIDASVSFNKKAYVYYLNNRIIGQISFYAFIGALVLIIGKELAIEKALLIKFIFLMLYTWSPLESVIILIPSLSHANTSLKRLTQLQKQIEVCNMETIGQEKIHSFNEVVMKNISYCYQNALEEYAFGIGPINFTLTAGEVVFVCGGNGSGKTTFINLMIGLFGYDKGEIYVDNKKIERADYPYYRSLFAPVFGDFHLFDQCYGIEKISPEKANGYLNLFELSGKVCFEDGKFTTINLSTGQRKRLALIYALLEKKPVLVLDEFAADQDPYFRKKFYTEILQALKSEGFTIIAVTHDDNYLACSDKLYVMEYGKLYLSEKVQLQASAV